MTSIKKSQPTLNTMLKIKLTDKQKRATAKAIEIQKKPKKIAGFRMFYKDNSGIRAQHKVFIINAKGRTNKELLADANRVFQIKKTQMEEDYPDFSDYALGEIPTVINEIKGGSVIANGVYSSTSKGQRNIKVSGNKIHTKMREGSSCYLKTSNNEEEWNTREGKCVFDYLIWKYGDKKGFIKKLGKERHDAEEFLNKLFIDSDYDDDEFNPLQDGVSIHQLERFCDYFNICMYAYDKRDQLISLYKPFKTIDGKGNKDAQPLIFVMFDNHFNPIEDKKDRKSKTERAKDNINCNQIEEYKDKEATKTEKKIKTLIAPTQEEYDLLCEKYKLKLIEDIYYDTISISNSYALDYIKKHQGKIPFPINCKNVYTTDNTIHKLSYNDNIVLTKPIDPFIKWFYGEDYQGECVIDIINGLFNELYGFKFKDAPFLSIMNNQVRDALSQEGLKYRVHIGNTGKYEKEEILKLLDEDKAIAVDITKCYSDCLYNQMEDFIVFSGKEIVEFYDKQPLTLGLYFVETSDLTLLHQSNWYSRKIIELAQSEGIVLKITKQIRCVDEEWDWNNGTEEEEGNIKLSNKILFRDIIDYIIEKTNIPNEKGDFPLTKQVINIISGLLGKTSTSNNVVGLSMNMDEVWTDITDNIYDNIPIKFNTIKDTDTTLHIYGYETKTNNISNGLPMYLQILDWSNCKLYKLGKAVGGEIIYRKTDCVVSVGGKLPISMLEDKTKPFVNRLGKYHEEGKEKAKLFNYDFEMKKNRHLNSPKNYYKPFVKFPFDNSTDADAIIKTAIDRGGMLITGGAGTGKSWIVEKGIELGLLDENPETRLAPTNRASRRINGMTIHKVLNVNILNKTNLKSLMRLKKYKVFACDEISMYNIKIWQMLLLLKKITGATFILIGDFNQCPPIEKNGYSVDYSNHPILKELVNYNCCNLTTTHRYDTGLKKVLELFISEGIIEGIQHKKQIYIGDIIETKNICYKNETRRNINTECMEFCIKDRTDFIELPVPTNCKNKYADKVYLYIGLNVMSVKNNKNINIINSEEWVVIDLNNNNLTLKNIDDERELNINTEIFHELFVANYASTTHKAQGATYTQKIMLFDMDEMKKNRKLGYTAMSRGKTCDQICSVDRRVLERE